MNSKSRSKRIQQAIMDVVKPVAFAGLIVIVLRVTGLISAASFATQWALLQTGLRDAEGESSPAAVPFDFSFTIKDLQGNKIPFDQFKGKVIFLNLWATWCGPCRAEMPGIQSLYEKMDKDQVTFIMLSIDDDTEIGRVSDYLARRKFTFQAYMPYGYLPEQLKVPSIPTTFVISKDGRVMKKEIGSMQYDTPKFQKFLEELSK